MESSSAGLSFPDVAHQTTAIAAAVNVQYQDRHGSDAMGGEGLAGKPCWGDFNEHRSPVSFPGTESRPNTASVAANISTNGARTQRISPSTREREKTGCELLGKLPHAGLRRQVNPPTDQDELNIFGLEFQQLRGGRSPAVAHDQEIRKAADAKGTFSVITDARSRKDASYTFRRDGLPRIAERRPRP